MVSKNPPVSETTSMSMQSIKDDPSRLSIERNETPPGDKRRRRVRVLQERTLPISVRWPEAAATRLAMSGWKAQQKTEAGEKDNEDMLFP